MANKGNLENNRRKIGTRFLLMYGGLFLALFSIFVAFSDKKPIARYLFFIGLLILVVGLFWKGKYKHLFT